MYSKLLLTKLLNIHVYIIMMYMYVPIGFWAIIGYVWYTHKAYYVGLTIMFMNITTNRIDHTLQSQNDLKIDKRSRADPDSGFVGLF